MDLPEAAFRKRCRRAYEIGRVGAAFPRVLALATLVAVALAGCDRPDRVLIVGAFFLAVVTFCLWRGGEYRLGVRPGVVAGLVPLLVPVIVRMSGLPCAAGACLLAPIVCAAGGVAGGLLLGFLAPRPAGSGVSFVAACAVAALAGALGCLTYGLIGLGVMIAGLCAGTLPVMVARRA